MPLPKDSSRRRYVVRRLSLLLAIVSIGLALWPWGDFQGHTHWAKVGWIPFVSPPVRVRDIIGNILLFMPLGAAVAVNSPKPRALQNAAMTAALLSFLGEWSQLYSHGRFPSATDLVCNTVGAATAAVLVCRWRK